MTDTSVLSQAEILKLKEEQLRLLEEQLRLAEGLPHLHGFKWYKWARTVFNSTNKEILLCAANQISKSSTAIRKNIHWATEPSLWPKLWPSLKPGQTPNMFWYFYPDLDTATIEFETKWKPLFLPRGEFKNDAKYGWEEIYDKGQIAEIKFKSGVTIYFKAYTQKSKNLQTGTVYMVTCDEECPMEHFNEIQARLFASDGYFMMVFTATLGQLYWDQAIEKIGTPEERHPEALKIQVSMYDCLHYDDGTPSHWTKERIARAIAKCSNEAEVQRRVFGRFVRTEGLMFESLTSDNISVEPHPLPRNWYNYSGVDPGTGGTSGHPSAIVFVAVSPDYKHGRVWRVWRGDKVLTSSIDILNKHTEMKGGRRFVVQSYDYQAKDFFIVASRRGESFVKADKSRDAGFQLVNTLFKTGALKIQKADSEAEKLIQEITSLPAVYDKSRSGERAVADDLVDALRYCVMAIPWDLSDYEIPSEDEVTKPEKQPTPLSESERRRLWFMGKLPEEPGLDHEKSVEEELDELNELSGA